MHNKIISVGIVLTLASFGAAAEDAAMASAKNAMKASKSGEVSFKNDIQPILRDHCISCHQPGASGYQKSGLDLTSYGTLMKGTVFGKVVIPGDSASSTFTKLLTGTNKGLKMPMGLNASGTLDRQYILLMRNWVKQGAKDN
ncbi:MAG: c-type cytochrome domain-containing protein [Gallionellaceae bacterium]|nr:c-type cytochrome domain-containing protein [Gallionellaceae bacterium]